MQEWKVWILLASGSHWCWEPCGRDGVSSRRPWEATVKLWRYSLGYGTNPKTLGYKAEMSAQDELQSGAIQRMICYRLRCCWVRVVSETKPLHSGYRAAGFGAHHAGFGLWSNISLQCHHPFLLEWESMFCAIVCWKYVIGFLIYRGDKGLHWVSEENLEQHWEC